MNRKKYLVIISLITAGCIALGITIQAMGLLIRGGKLAAGALGNVGRAAGVEQVTKDYDVEAFTSLDMDVSLGDVFVEEGNGYSVQYKGVKELMPRVESEHGKLTISQKDSKLSSWANHSNPLAMDNSLTITVPAGTILKKADVKLGMGDFKISGIGAGEADLRLNMGNLDLKNCAFDDMEIKADMGNVTIDGVQTAKAELKSSMGNISAAHLEGLEKLSLDCDMGNIDLDLSQHIDDLTLDLDADMGTIKVNGDKVEKKGATGSGAIKITAKADLGNVNINTDK